MQRQTIVSNDDRDMNKETDIEVSRVASREVWLRARQELLEREKEWIRQRDALSAERRKLPMVRLEKDYVFEGPHGRRSLRDLFEGRRQLLVHHFMFDPAWDEGCLSCSFVADHFAGMPVHLAARETSLAAISRAPFAKIERFKKRMGWDFPWLSSFGTDFNYDFQVTLDEPNTEYNYAPFSALPEHMQGLRESEAPGLSVFVRDGERVFHTYSTYTRGFDSLLNTYNFLDLSRSAARKRLARRWARDRSVRWPRADGLTGWARYHDKYRAYFSFQRCSQLKKVVRRSQ